MSLCWVVALAALILLQKMPLPQFQPMPLGRTRDLFCHSEWLFEVKWDGSGRSSKSIRHSKVTQILTFLPQSYTKHSTVGVRTMLWFFSVIFALAWLAGLVSGNTFDGSIHVLLVLAVTALAFEFISRRQSVV
jgi:hypothetical protein